LYYASVIIAEILYTIGWYSVRTVFVVFCAKTICTFLFSVTSIRDFLTSNLLLRLHVSGVIAHSLKLQVSTTLHCRVKLKHETNKRTDGQTDGQTG